VAVGERVALRTSVIKSREPEDFRTQKSTSEIPKSSLAARIRAVRLELADLEQQQRNALLYTIAAVVGPGVCFSANELFTHRTVCSALQTALDEIGIESPRQLGKKLKQLGLTRIGADEHGVIWMCD
jgi:hypothetical protein